MPNWDTAANIINDAAVELALISSDVADPYASSDINLVQLVRHLKSLGQDLVRDYQWTHLQRQHTFNTVAGVDTYQLPTDFQRFIDQTGWNRTQRMPLIGPVSPQGWQQLQVMTSAGVVDIMYRIVGDQLKLFPAPQADDTISYEFISDLWVSHVGDTEPLTNAPVSGAEQLWFDRRLLVCGVKLRWLRAKGFDTTAAQDDYDRALSRAQGGDGVAPVLNLNRQPFTANRALDLANVPETGFGT